MTLAAVLLATSVTAHAEEPGQQSQMLRISDAGYEAFQNGEFAIAAQKFARAYELEPNATLLKNEAIAWLEAGEAVKALDASNRFLVRDDIDGDDARQIQKVWAIAKLALAETAIQNGDPMLARRLIDEVESSNPDRVISDRAMGLRLDLARASQPEAAPAETRKVEPVERSADVVATADRPMDRSPGAVVTAVGAATLAGAVTYHILALSWQGRFRNADLTDEKTRALQSRLGVARVLVPTLYGLGGAITGVGVWLMIDPPRKPESASYAATTPDGYVGLGLRLELQ